MATKKRKSRKQWKNYKDYLRVVDIDTYSFCFTADSVEILKERVEGEFEGLYQNLEKEIKDHKLEDVSIYIDLEAVEGGYYGTSPNIVWKATLRGKEPMTLAEKKMSKEVAAQKKTKAAKIKELAELGERLQYEKLKKKFEATS